MGTQYIGEIRMFAGNFAPAGWAFCSGQVMAIAEASTLFNLIGTTYGGDGQQTFCLPNLCGRVPIHVANGFVQGQSAGVENVTLTTQTIPNHSHTLAGSDQSPQSNPASATTLGVAASAQQGVAVYASADGSTTLNPAGIGPTGGNQPHENMQPYLVVDFIIALVGIYPTPN